MHFKPEKPINIGVLRLSALGDVINALAAVTSLKEHFKKAKITWFIGKVEHQLLKDIPGISFEVINKKEAFKERKRIKEKYKDTQFDVLLHMQRSLRCSLIIGGLKSKNIIGFDKPRAKELQWMFTNQKIDKPKSPHAVDVFMEFAYKLGVDKENQIAWDLGEFLNLDELKSEIGFELDSAPYVGLVVSGSQKDRAWSPKKNAEVIDWITNNTSYNVILLGGPSEFEVAQSNEICNKLKRSHEKVINLTGKTSLKSLKSIISRAKLIISPDTGPIHLASALNIPSIGLYVHMPKEITGPYNFLDMTVDHYPQALKKYYKQDAPDIYEGIPKRIKNFEEAINSIQVDEVIKKIQTSLGTEA